MTPIFILAPMAILVLLLGGAMVAPLAYRRGVNAGRSQAADIIAWGLQPDPVRVGRHRMTARESRARYRAQVRAWWVSTAPRDVHAPVERALARQAFGRPPANLVGRAA